MRHPGGLSLIVPQMPSAGAMRSAGQPWAPASPGTAVGGGQEGASFCRAELAGEHPTCQAARCHPGRMRDEQFWSGDGFLLHEAVPRP